MSRVFVAGVGAVSPAGWGLPPLRDALQAGVRLPVEPLERPTAPPLRCRPVPAPAPRPAFLAHPRLRRASALTHYAAGAALEAMTPLQNRGSDGGRIGVVVCLDAGCVQYSCRFFDEVVKDPAIASPLLFPETVFAAVGSGVAALLPRTPLLYALVGDSATFLQGLAVAADWLADGRVDTGLVVGAEEINWLLADALWNLDRAAVLSAGAGAIGLVSDPALSLGVELQAITDPHTYTASLSRPAAARAMRRDLSSGNADGLLCDSQGENPATNRAEAAAWQTWSGPRLSPRRILGEGLVAATAWQCAAGVDAIVAGSHSAANISAVGTNQQAIGARFTKVRHE